VGTKADAKQRYFDKFYAKGKLVPCACGCGRLINSHDKYGRTRKYISGHNRRKYKDSKEYKKQYNKHKKSKYTEMRGTLIKIMGGKCIDCGYMFDGTNTRAFDFHHIDKSKKKFGLSTSQMVQQNWEEILSEIKKCVLLCARCHRLRH